MGSITFDKYINDCQRYLKLDPTVTENEMKLVNSASKTIAKVKDKGIQCFSVLGLITVVASINLLFSAKILFGGGLLLVVPLTLGTVGVLIAIDLYTTRNALQRVGKIFEEINELLKKNEEIKKEEKKSESKKETGGFSKLLNLGANVLMKGVSGTVFPLESQFEEMTRVRRSMDELYILPNFFKYEIKIEAK